MSAYINVDTMEYPRYEGDITISPDANWAEVQATPIPEYTDGQAPYELTPLLIDGVWTQQWAVRDLTLEEIENNKQFHLNFLNKSLMRQEDIDRLMGA